MKTPLEILDGITADNCEATYQAFYPACQVGGFAVEVVAKVDEIYHGSHDPVLKSYCFLLLGAVVDSGKLSRDACQKLVEFLAAELNSLTDYTLKDDQGRYIHYLSHMAFLAGSLRESADITPIYEALLSAYLRADVQICGGEDVVVAEVLLGAKNVSDVLARLTRQEGEPPLILEANKKSLWMAMFVLNGALKKHGAALFAPLVDDLVSMVQD